MPSYTIRTQSDLSDAVAAINAGSGNQTVLVDGLVPLSGFGTGLMLTGNQQVVFGGGGQISGSLGAVTMDGTSLDIAGLGASLHVGSLSATADSNIQLGTNSLVVDATSPGTVATGIQGSGGLQVAGAALTVTGYQNYTGRTDVTGTLRLAGSGSLAQSSGVVLGSSGVLDVSGSDTYDSVQSLSGSGTVILGSTELSVSQSGTGVFSGTISGAGGLNVLGTGIFQLTGTIGAGNTTIQTGTLQLATGSHLTSTTISDNGLLVFGNGTVTVTAQISGSGAVRVDAGNAVTFTTHQNYSGQTTVNGTLQLGAGGTTGAIDGNVIVDAGGTLAVNRSDRLSYSGTIGGAGAVAQNGSGTLALSGANSYGGGTLINAGTLELIGAAAAGSGTITFGTPGGTLLLDTATPGNAIAGFTIGDMIDLRSIGLASAAVLAGNTLTLSGASGTTSLQLADPAAFAGMHFVLAGDSAGGTALTVAAGAAGSAPSGNTGTGTDDPATVSYTGASDDYVITPANGGGLTVQQGSSTPDSVAANTALRFSNGTALPDPTGLVGDVARLYQAAFARNPDLSGVEYWSGQAVGSNVTLNAIAASFAASPEFSSSYGMLDDNGFVAQLYRNVLHREADSAGQSYWTGILATGTARGDVLNAFAQSDENVAATGTLAGTLDQAEAYRLYQAAFNRTPDAAGLSYWSHTLASAGAAQVAQGFTQSAEFQAAFAGEDSTAFVQQLYRNVLGRDGDASGAGYWSGLLNSGTSQAQVLQGFADSGENLSRTASATHAGWVLIPA